MKYLVSGASGFIGEELCNALRAEGASVLALSRSGAALADGSATTPMDLTKDLPSVAQLTGVKAVFHLAGIAHQQAQPSAYQQLNVDATLRLARAAAAAGVESFVFLSSVKAMGASGGTTPRLVADTALPRDDYGLSKWRAEQALREEFFSGAMKVIILRPALVYGPAAKGNLALLARAVRAGVPRPPALGQRSMVSREDLVTLMQGLPHRPLKTSKRVSTWLVCDGAAYSTRDVYDVMRLALGLSEASSWLPLWVWRVAARVLDWRSGGGADNFEKLFGTELYDNSELLAASDWRPKRRLADFANAMMAPEKAAYLS